MKTADFDFHLPANLIAQKPIAGARDLSRLMVLNKNQQTIVDKHFFDLCSYVRSGDILVFNNSKVFPARLVGKKQNTGGKIEVFLLKKITTTKTGVVWEALVGGKHVATGQKVVIKDQSWELLIEIHERLSPQTRKVTLFCLEEKLPEFLEHLGQTPIPPYIHQMSLPESELRKKYQTVYAKHEGSVAAPTAGFHFTKELLQKLKDQGVNIAYITLHVGLGTFAPVKVDDVLKHHMHSEYAVVSPASARLINNAKEKGGRVIAVGTTSVRTLESFSQNGVLQSGEKWTNIFITPGYEFQCVHGMITNFHLPKSTLFMLVCAFAGTDFMKHAYAEAIKNKYRFYSFGDAMLIL